MIHKVDFDRGPINPGEKRAITIHADGQIVIDFWCFRDPPGQFTVCGKLKLRPNETHMLAPPIDHFPRGVGRWRLVIRDTHGGHTETIDVEVRRSFPTPTAAEALG